jgi:hypothetical protein
MVAILLTGRADKAAEEAAKQDAFMARPGDAR